MPIGAVLAYLTVVALISSRACNHRDILFARRCNDGIGAGARDIVNVISRVHPQAQEDGGDGRPAASGAFIALNVSAANASPKAKARSFTARALVERRIAASW